MRTPPPPDASPHVVVLASLFPSAAQPGAGLFIRERMFRVARALPLCVVSPAPWFPLQSLARRLRPGFRKTPPRHERQQGIDVWHPRFPSLPAIGKRFDGLAMALGALPTLRELKRQGRLDVIDAHFAYPDGYAAVRLGRWLGVPVAVTIRGTEARHARTPGLRSRVAYALANADRVFAVSESLRRVAVSLGVAAERVRVVGNGVDCERFAPLDRALARRELGISEDADVIVSVGGLVERKGFHRIVECLPELRRERPRLVYLIVGGPSPEGDWTKRLHAQVAALALGDCVRFVGMLAPEALRVPLSAADVFALATSHEGWANVFLEAMACGLPVVTTDVGGNPEVVCDAALGTIVPFGDARALHDALAEALARRWDRAAIRRHAETQSWDSRVAVLTAELRALAAGASTPRAGERRSNDVAIHP